MNGHISVQLEMTNNIYEYKIFKVRHSETVMNQYLNKRGGIVF